MLNTGHMVQIVILLAICFIACIGLGWEFREIYEAQAKLKAQEESCRKKINHIDVRR